MNAKDLTREFPRGPLEELGGLPWLARLIDKVRALHAGTLGEYAPFPCGGDRRFLATMGLEPEPLSELIKSGASDDQIRAYVEAHATAGWPERLEAYRAYHRTPITDGEYFDYLNKAKAALAAQRPDLDLSKVDNFTRLICAEEGYALP